MTNNSTRRNRILTAAAVAAFSAIGLPSLVWAQHPAAGQDGHANDASNRVGSNGYNTGRPNAGSAATPNDIVNRNVTGGKEFRGPILEKDPRAFTGPSAGAMNDIFVRQSNGVPTDAGAPQGGLYTARPFYGESRFVNPPAGSLPEGFNGGYIGTVANSPSSLSNGLNAEPTLGLQTRTTDRENLRLTQSFNGNGDLNSNTPQDALNGSPVLGLHTNVYGTDEFGSPQSTDRLTADEKMSARLRRQDGLESEKPSGPNSTKNGVQNGQKQPSGPNQPLNQTLAQPFDAPLDSAVSSRIINSEISNSPLSATGTISPNGRQRPTLTPAGEQSTLLDTLQQRLARSGDVGKALVDARPASTPRTARTTAGASNKPNAGAITVPDSEQGPVKVSSLATGVKAKPLHDLLVSAEELMREGKYDSAIQKYSQGQRMAPNNPLNPLGRATAELAGGYYARAEQDLRQVFRSDPELLLAQFDLPGMLPKDRIDFVRKDLHNLTQTDNAAVRPWFLLAYLDYNTGDAASAEKDLKEAEQRSNRGDWAVRLLRAHWSLPSNPKTESPAPKLAVPAPPTPAAPQSDSHARPPDLNK